jgi:phosphatidylethanolamine/phosphatidyl-N-methylethanolamine N-methyltransferase
MTITPAQWNRWRYTAYAPFYDTLVRPFQEARRRAIEQLALQAGEQVLIIGAGTGLDLLFLPATIAVTAIDITPAMVKRTADRGRGFGRGLNTAVMNAEALGFPSATFDCVLLHLILAVVPDPVACAREAARVLKIGGRVSVFDKFLSDEATPSPFAKPSMWSRILPSLISTASLALSYNRPRYLCNMRRQLDWVGPIRLSALLKPPRCHDLLYIVCMKPFNL